MNSLLSNPQGLFWQVAGAQLHLLACAGLPVWLGVPHGHVRQTPHRYLDQWIDSHLTSQISKAVGTMKQNRNYTCSNMSVLLVSGPQGFWSKVFWWRTTPSSGTATCGPSSSSWMCCPSCPLTWRTSPPGSTRRSSASTGCCDSRACLSFLTAPRRAQTIPTSSGFATLCSTFWWSFTGTPASTTLSPSLWDLARTLGCSQTSPNRSIPPWLAATSTACTGQLSRSPPSGRCRHRCEMKSICLSSLTFSLGCWSLPQSWATSAPWSPTWMPRAPSSKLVSMPSNTTCTSARSAGSWRLASSSGSTTFGPTRKRWMSRRCSRTYPTSCAPRSPSTFIWRLWRKFGFFKTARQDCWWSWCSSCGRRSSVRETTSAGKET